MVTSIIRTFILSDATHGSSPDMSFFCYCGLRISDIKKLTWIDINDDVIIKQLKKGEDNHPEKTVIPISKPAKRFLPAEKPGNHKVFRPFAAQYSNLMLRDICKLEAVKIKRQVTYHTSRHTFGFVRQR